MKTMMIEILTIRKIRTDDFEPLYELLADPEVMEFLEPPFTRDRTMRFLESAGLSDPPLIYAVENEKGDFIGYVIYHDYDEDSKEIGWVLKKYAWGKGFAKQLTEQLIARAYSEGKSTVIECVPEQVVTKHLAELFGFTYTGRIEGRDVYRLGFHGNGS